MPGKLVLIGCGPGGVDLLTMRAARRIAEADLVLYDRLVDPDENADRELYSYIVLVLS